MMLVLLPLLEALLLLWGLVRLLVAPAVGVLLLLLLLRVLLRVLLLLLGWAGAPGDVTTCVWLDRRKDGSKQRTRQQERTMRWNSCKAAATSDPGSRDACSQSCVPVDNCTVD
jgi:hypothetical protein